MKAVVCPVFGGPEVLRVHELDEPEFAPDEVLVRIEAAGLNFPDLLSIAGTYPIPSEPPFIAGVEGAGTIAACGAEVRRFAPGDRVCWQDNVRKGSFAEAIALPERGLARVPDDVDSVAAACLPTAWGTARFALEHRAGLLPGEVLLVHGASGGVGLAAVQLGKLMGATVIATGGSAEKLRRVRAEGADHVLATGREDLREAIFDLTGGRGANVVLDPVGGTLFDLSLKVMAPYGRLLVVGFTSGEFPVARANILLVKALSVIGVNYGHFLAHEPEAARDAIEMMLGWVAKGRLRLPVHAVYDLAQAADALGDLQDRKVVGKLALRIAASSAQDQAAT